MLSSLTVKREQFAQKFVECGISAEAYRHAYSTDNMKDAAIYVESCRLLANPKVSLRVKELKERVADKHGVTMEYIVEGIKSAIEIAKDKDDAGNVRGAFMDLAKLKGLVIDKKEDVNRTAEIKERQKDVAERAFQRRESETKH